MVIECPCVAGDGNQVRLSYLGRVYREVPVRYSKLDQCNKVCIFHTYASHSY